MHLFLPRNSNSSLALLYPLKPILGGSRRCGTPAHTPGIAATLLEPLARAHVELPVKLGRGLLAMNEVAEAAADTALTAIQPTAGFAEIRHGREFAVYGPAGVPAAVEGVAGFLGVLFVLEAHVDVADEICGEVMLARCHMLR